MKNQLLGQKLNILNQRVIGDLLHIEVQNYGDRGTLLHNGTHSCVRFVQRSVRT